ncbi:MAG: hypothetical protein M1834_003478 [Cirrosporium novae-zelandiae]|nr:MAG: hypothetical protein M1834_003478 [Cirrosporium novae-zelandiae]
MDSSAVMDDTQLAADSMGLDTQQEPGWDTQFDEEIQRIRSQIKSLTSRRSLLTSSILSSQRTTTLLSRRISQPHLAEHPFLDHVIDLSAAQIKHSTLQLHRLCTGCTTFLIKDPDPNAVDSNRVFGIRIEVPVGDSFLPPYYIFLNRPSTAYKGLLKIHRHTIPPAIPLAIMAKKYLPFPARDTMPEKAKKQNLGGLVREVRRELVGWCLRKQAVENLDKNLRGKHTGGGILKNVSITDAEATCLRLEWEGGKMARIKLSKNGIVNKAAVFGYDQLKRDHTLEKNLVDRGLCVNELVRVLTRDIEGIS